MRNLEHERERDRNIVEKVKEKRGRHIHRMDNIVTKRRMDRDGEKGHL